MAIPGSVFANSLMDLGASVSQVEPEEVAVTVQRLLNDGKVVWQSAPDRGPVLIYSISYQTLWRKLKGE